MNVLHDMLRTCAANNKNCIGLLDFILRRQCQRVGLDFSLSLVSPSLCSEPGFGGRRHGPPGRGGHAEANLPLPLWCYASCRAAAACELFFLLFLRKIKPDYFLAGAAAPAAAGDGEVLTCI